MYCEHGQVCKKGRPGKLKYIQQNKQNYDQHISTLGSPWQVKKTEHRWHSLKILTSKSMNLESPKVSCNLSFQ